MTREARMRGPSRGAVAAMLGLCALYAGAGQPPANAAVPWPPGAVAGGTYVVQPTEAVFSSPSRDIVLPDNFTIKFAPGVSAVQWTAGSLSFGVGATIDLSGPGVT